MQRRGAPARGVAGRLESLLWTLRKTGPVPFPYRLFAVCPRASLHGKTVLEFLVKFRVALLHARARPLGIRPRQMRPPDLGRRRRHFGGLGLKGGNKNHKE